MKSIYIFALITFFVGFWTVDHAQDIPNPSFEDWSKTKFGYEDPDSWTTSNKHTNTLGAGTGVNKTTDAIDGDSAVSMITLGVGFAGQPFPAFMVNGTPTLNKITGIPDFKNSGGTPISKMPAALTGSYKYTQNFPNDSGQVHVIIKAKGAQIGFGSLNFAHTNNYKTFTVEITDLSAGVTPPDTIVIAFFSTSPVDPIKNGRLWIDDLALDFPSSIEDPTEIVASNAYPNPVSDILTIGIKEIPEDGVLNIYSTNGQLLRSNPLTSIQTQIDVSEFAKGAYFYTVSDSKIRKDQGRFIVK